jgi:hypothetical protein
VNASCRYGRAFRSKAAADGAVRKGADGDSPFKCRICPVWHLHKPVMHTGFSDDVKLATRRRAGGGDLFEAVCEACGAWLGEKLGEIQHVVARGAGGTSLDVMDSCANAALLCGSAVWHEGSHAEAEDRDPQMGRTGSSSCTARTPGTVPMKLHDGRDVYRSVDGSYLNDMPELEAA